MFTVELLKVDWDHRDSPSVVGRIPSHSGRLGDANMIAKSLLDDTTQPSPNAYQIRDDAGDVVLRSWERSI